MTKESKHVKELNSKFLYYIIKKNIKGGKKMEQYEYYTFIYDTKGFWGGSVDVSQFQNKLNDLGNDGWELVSSVSTNQSYGSSKSIVCIFKRKKM